MRKKTYDLDDIAKIEQNLAKVTKQMEAAREACRKANSAFEKIHKKWDKLRNVIDEHKLADCNDIEILLFEDGNVSSVAYKKREQFLQSLKLSSFGYIPEIKQVAVKFYLYRKACSHNDEVVSNLKMLLPYVKPVKFSKGVGKLFSILESTCGEDGCFAIYVTEETVYLCKTYYGREAFMDMGSFDNAMTYIQEHHYYDHEYVEYE